MFTFVFYIIPILVIWFGVIFYSATVNKEESGWFLPRLIRWILLVASFCPGLSWAAVVLIVFALCDEDTKLKNNKITDFFIKN